MQLYPFYNGKTTCFDITLTINMMPYICKTLTAVVVFVFSLTCKAQEMVVSVQTIPATCYGKANGKIAVHVTDFRGTYTAAISEHKDSRNYISRKGPVSDTLVVFDGIKAGKYFITVTGKTGSSIQKETEVTEPGQLLPGEISIEKGLSAFDSKDARLKANPAGGTPPYRYSWSSNAGGLSDQVVKGLGQGTYICTINDVNNCGPVKSTIFFYKQVHPDSIPDEAGNSNSKK